MRPKFAHVLSRSDRDTVLALLIEAAVWIEPSITVADCHDAKDNKYLELAMAVDADIIVSSDNDLLVLNPWRSIRIIRPVDYLNTEPIIEAGPPS